MSALPKTVIPPTTSLRASGSALFELKVRLAMRRSNVCTPCSCAPRVSRRRAAEGTYRTCATSSIDVMADRLDAKRGALHKTLHDARGKLREHLEGQDLTFA
jgi:hypothetical protein